MKIALVSSFIIRTPPTGGYGGLERVVYWLGKSLVEMGHDVTLIASRGSYLEGAEVVETVEAPERVNVDWLELEREAYYKYKHLLKDQMIIHDHSWFLAPYLYKREENPDIKILHTHHSYINFRTLPVAKPNFVALSKFHSYALSRQLLGSTWRYCYNGIPVEEFRYSGDREDFYVFLGRISRVKAPDVAIKVARDAGVKLYVIGGDKFVDDPSYVDMVKTLCDGEQIIYLGEQPRETVIDYLSRAKALLFTNDPLLFKEPFGLVAAEANASGCGCIAINNGAVAEVVRHGVTGFVVQSPEDMAEVIKTGLIEEINPANCRRWVERNFSRQVMAKNYLSLYRDVLEGMEW